MTYQTIKALSWYIKPHWVPPITEDETSEDDKMAYECVSDAFFFAYCYQQLDFGWNFTKLIRDNKIPFPLMLTDNDLHLWEAYCFLFGISSPAVETAIQIHFMKDKHLRSQINAMLMAPDCDTKRIAKYFSLPHKSLIAYEKLFCNVLDRRKDAKLIPLKLHPRGRWDELEADYREATDKELLTMRGGYHNGMESVAHIAGLRIPVETRETSVAENAESLEGIIMQNAKMIISMNGLSGGANVQALRLATNFIQAAKMGGAESGETSPADFIGNAVLDDLGRIAVEEVETRMAYNRSRTNLPSMAEQS